MKEPFYYTLGAEIEMYYDGKWVKGRVIDGYRFRDGIITMQTDDGQRIWCGEASGQWRKSEREENKE